MILKSTGVRWALLLIAVLAIALLGLVHDEREVEGAGLQRPVAEAKVASAGITRDSVGIVSASAPGAFVSYSYTKCTPTWYPISLQWCRYTTTVISTSSWQQTNYHTCRNLWTGRVVHVTQYGQVFYKCPDGNVPI